MRQFMVCCARKCSLKEVVIRISGCTSAEHASVVPGREKKRFAVVTSIPVCL
jgi:hypothetical protein